MRPFAIVFAVAAATAFLVTPLARRFAIRMGAVDVPSDRRVHIEPTPLLGGLGMFAGLCVAMAVAWILPEFRDLFRVSSQPWAVLVAATVVVVLGMIDDKRALSAPTKLAGHVIAAGVLVLGGVQIFYVWLPGVGVVSLSTELSALVTVLWTIAVINAVNLIDGLDGLAVGVTTIASVAFFIYAYATSPAQASLEQLNAELLTVIVAGVGIGFLRYNFNPARIFMGDTGAYLLGLLLAVATVSGISRTTEPKFVDVAGFFVPVLLPVLVLAIPLADAGFAILRRVRGGTPVFHPDKQHIHHWLWEMARSHRQAVLVMYLWSALLASATLVLALGPGFAWRLVSAGIMAVLIASVILLPRRLRRDRDLRLVATEEAEAGTG